MTAAPPAARRRRRGLTLVEIVVVMAILAVMAAVSIPTLTAYFDLQQRGAARELAQTYTWLVDEAVLRNVSFRVVYNLDMGTWKVEVGDPEARVFGTPEEREAHERELEDEMARFTEREIEEGALAELQEAEGGFASLDQALFKTEQALPGGTRFAWVYTPQYGEDGARPSAEPPEDPEDQVVAYSHVFPNGTAEHTVVRIAGEDDEDGYTIEVEPLSGQVHLDTDLLDPSESFDWVPEEGPELHQ